METDSKDRAPSVSNAKYYLLFGILMILALAYWTAYCIWASERTIWAITESDSSTTTGQFGDAFGVLNCLFSSVSVAGAICAIILQQKELKAAREEYHHSRVAHVQSAGSQALMAQLQYYSSYLDHLNAELSHRRSRMRAVLKLRSKTQKLWLSMSKPDATSAVIVDEATELIRYAGFERLFEEPHAQYVENLKLLKSDKNAFARTLGSQLGQIKSAIDVRISDYDSEIVTLKERRDEAVLAIQGMLEKSYPSSSKKPHPPASDKEKPSSV